MSGSERVNEGEALALKGAVTIVTQTRVRPESADAFARWQGETSKVIAGFPGFIEQKVMPPSPPTQVDWVILQRFASALAMAGATGLIAHSPCAFAPSGPIES